jgi:hypothetical protein
MKSKVSGLSKTVKGNMFIIKTNRSKFRLDYRGFLKNQLRYRVFLEKRKKMKG